MWLCPSCYQLTGFFSLWSFYKFTLSHISHYHISIVDFLNKNILVGVEDLTTFFFPSQLWMVFSQYQAAWLVVEDIHHPVQVHHTVVVNHDCGQVREAWLSHRWTQMCFDGSESRLALLIIYFFLVLYPAPGKKNVVIDGGSFSLKTILKSFLSTLRPKLHCSAKSAWVYWSFSLL